MSKIMITEQDIQELRDLKGREINGNSHLVPDPSDPSVQILVYDKIIDSSSDDIRFKEIVKQRLTGINDEGNAQDKLRTASNSRKLIHVLDNQDLSEDCPSDYLYKSILPYYILDGTQTTIKNYVCFESTYKEISSYDSSIKLARIVFYILCDVKNNNIQDEDTGIARHDLLGQIIMDEFNFSNCFGLRFHCISNEPSMTDNSYATRTITFESIIPNNIVSRNSLINSKIRR